jgi:hypothetical protein
MPSETKRNRFLFALSRCSARCREGADADEDEDEDEDEDGYGDEVGSGGSRGASP